jgi:2-polyprenyl-6-methoxyphenol hydroxylase-like FAD-dependent oxidoreductase
MWAIVFKDEYSQPPKPYKPDAKETEEVALRYKDLQITEDLTFGDLWATKKRHGLLSIEEGVLSKWHAGRIVLLGDSAHKVSLQA